MEIVLRALVGKFQVGRLGGWKVRSALTPHLRTRTSERVLPTYNLRLTCSTHLFLHAAKLPSVPTSVRHFPL